MSVQMTGQRMAPCSFANSLATRIEALVWLLAVQDEHEAYPSSMSNEFIVTHVEPLTTELLGIHNQIELIRDIVQEQKHDSCRNFQSNSGRYLYDKEQLHDSFLGVDAIPVEFSELSEVMAHCVTGTASSSLKTPWELQADAVADEYTPAQIKTCGVEQAASSKPMSLGTGEAYTKPNQTSLLQQAAYVEVIAARSHVVKKASPKEGMDSGPTVPYAERASGDVRTFRSSEDLAVGRYAIDDRDTGSASVSALDRSSYELFQTLDIWHSKEHESVFKKTMARLPVYNTLNSGANSVFKKTSKATIAEVGQSWFEHIVIPPGSLGRTLWDLMAAILVIEECIRIPMGFLDMPEHWFLQMMAWIVRFFWTIDLGLNLITGYIDDHGLSEMRLNKIFKRYANTWLAPDMFLVASDWVDMVIEISTSESGVVRLTKSTRVTRSLRALRLVRMERAMQIATRGKFSVNSDKLMVVVDTVKICVVFALFTHLVSCLWCGLGAWESEHGSQTWIQNAGMVYDPIGSLYLVSCIWVLAQFSGGTDFPLPQNVVERLFNTIALLICFVASAAFVSFLTRSTTKLLLLSSGPSQQMRQLRDYLVYHRVSSRLMQRIKKNAHFVAFGQRSAIAEEDVELLHRISEPLQTELAMEIRGPVLVVHPFFESYSRFCLPGMRQLCEGATQTKTVLSDDPLFMKGERQIEPHMFFVYVGTMSYQRTKAFSSTVSLGEWIAEMVLWTDWTHRGTLTAVSNCQVISVHAKTFYDIVKKFDASLEAATLYAREFVRHLNTLSLMDLSDLDWDLTRAFSFEDIDRQVVMLKSSR